MRARHFASVLVAVALTGCKESQSIVYSPVATTEVRHAVDAVSAGRGHAAMRDTEGKIHEADLGTPLKASGSSDRFRLAGYGRYRVDEQAAELVLNDVVEDCKAHKECLLDDPLTHWQVGGRRRVVNGTAVALVGLGAALVTGNVVCFGTDACSGSAKTLIGAADVLTGVAALVTLVAVAAFAVVAFSPGD
jgi:hypothetical protein